MKKPKAWICYGCGVIVKKGYFCENCGFSETLSRKLEKQEKIYALNKKRINK